MKKVKPKLKNSLKFKENFVIIFWQLQICLFSLLNSNFNCTPHIFWPNLWLCSVLRHENSIKMTKCPHLWHGTLESEAPKDKGCMSAIETHWGRGGYPRPIRIYPLCIFMGTVDVVGYELWNVIERNWIMTATGVSWQEKWNSNERFMVQFQFNFDSRKMSKPNRINNALDKRDNKYDYIKGWPEKCHLHSAMYFWILLLLASSCVGLPADLDLDYGVAEPQRTALLQYSLMVQFALHHKRIPRLTYFTCRKPHSSGSELRGVFAAKNAQLIKSLYQSELFVRIVQLDVLAPNSGGGSSAGSGAGGGASRGRGPSGGFSQTLSQAQSNAEWLDSVLRMEALRQIAVVDLACGSLSRRFLELVRWMMEHRMRWVSISGALKKIYLNIQTF